MPAPHSARANASATTAAVNMMPVGTPRGGPPTNPLLVKDEVGKAKVSCYDLPTGRFAYGRPGNHDTEGAREVSMYWVSHKPSKASECTAPDFVRFNKRAASARVTTARDLAYYRKENDVMTPRYGVSGCGAPPRVIPSDVVDGFTYGKKVRPSTPIDEVMSHRFAEQAEDHLKQCYATYHGDNDRASTRVRKIPQTVASRGHASARSARSQKEEAGREANHTHFKMGKFKNANSKINNGRQKAPHVDLIAQLLKDATPSEGDQEALKAAEASDEKDPKGAYATF